jgi:murein DD-endopeptidase MepM/ murein hydrolase activator NlpD
MFTTVASATATNEVAEWVTYVDPRFDFTVEYPSDWLVIPRNDSRGVGGMVTFSNIVPQSALGETTVAGLPNKVEIGTYLVEWNNDRPIEEWIDKYNNLISSESDNMENEISSSQRLFVDGIESLRRDGSLPSGFIFRYTNIPRGKIVWLIWSNVDETHLASYDHMINSFKFSEKTPMTLQDAYGLEFQPFSLEASEHPDAKALSEPTSPTSDLSSSWRVPTYGYYNVTCAHPQDKPHSHAIDIPVITGTSVYATKSGTVEIAGPAPEQQWGILVKIRHVWTLYTYVYSYYAHLSGVNVSANSSVSTGALVGWSGNTGQSSGPHLHFHVQYYSTYPVDLTGMSGFYPNGNYPAGVNCGYVNY